MVMPQDMTAVINFRLRDGDTVESVMAHCREAVQDKGVEMRFLQANDPLRHRKARRLRLSQGRREHAALLPGRRVHPVDDRGATDAHRYEEICDTCLRCSRL